MMMMSKAGDPLPPISGSGPDIAIIEIKAAHIVLPTKGTAYKLLSEKKVSLIDDAHSRLREHCLKV